MAWISDREGEQHFPEFRFRTIVNPELRIGKVTSRAVAGTGVSDCTDPKPRYDGRNAGLREIPGASDSPDCPPPSPLPPEAVAVTMPNLISHNEQETEDFGQLLGQALEGGTVIGLVGTLGAGKTRLTQAIARGLEISDSNVVSPTFTLCIPYHGRLGLLHLDAYRIQSDEEVDELGLDECVENGAVLIVEWADRIEALLPPLDLGIELEVEAGGLRKLTLQAYSATGERLINGCRPAGGWA